ncbi:MAG: hypothetical protein AABX12_02030 [Nanoarchaeota archaeon]
MHKKEDKHEHHAAHTQHTPQTSHQLEERLIDNLVQLQRVHTDLADKFDKLSKQIADLVGLFELSARAFAKQVNIPGAEKDREFLDKIDKLLEQNKTIAKGLTLVEEKMRERLYGTPTHALGSRPQYAPDARPLPRI